MLIAQPSKACHYSWRRSDRSSLDIACIYFEERLEECGRTGCAEDFLGSMWFGFMSNNHKLTAKIVLKP